MAVKRALNLEQKSALKKSRPVAPKQKKVPTKPTGKKSRPSSKISPKSKEASSSSDSDEVGEDDNCLYCHDFSAEGWIRCNVCFQWAHNSCAGVESEDDDAIHVCAFCE